MKILDSRRLTGPNLLLPGPGAILDVELHGGEPASAFVEAWLEQLTAILQAVGWNDAERAQRVHPHGVSLAFSAPIDALYAATEVNEWAFEAAQAVLEDRIAPDPARAAPRLRLIIDQEANPALIRLQQAAIERDVTMLWDDDQASVGLGTGSLTFPAREIPPPDAIDWDGVHDVPVALVTGTNGKTTTVRMLSAIAAHAGRSVGYTSTEGIVVAGEVVEPGDWSGPGGARRVLRDQRVDLAVLECARGGMLRRGLGVPRARVGVVTNVASDHLGEWGVEDLDALAEAKLIVARAAEQMVLNADDPLLVRHAGTVQRPLTWFTTGDASSHEASPVLQEAASKWWVEGGEIRAEVGCLVTDHVASVDEIPTTLSGAAQHNVANALAAAAAAFHLSSSNQDIAGGLRDFKSNPGRLDRFSISGVEVLVDFAHNPHGLEALFTLVRRLPHKRWLVTLSHGGDRSQQDLEDYARTAAEAGPDRIIVKELRKYLRGREVGEIPEILIHALLAAGYEEARIDRADSEMESVRTALDWAQPGDLLLLLTLAEREAVVGYLKTQEARGRKQG